MDYYGMVVNVARMLNKPKLSKTELFETLTKITKALGKKIDDAKLTAAWKEFASASAPRIVYA